MKDKRGKKLRQREKIWITKGTFHKPVKEKMP